MAPSPSAASMRPGRLLTPAMAASSSPYSTIACAQSTSPSVRRSHSIPGGAARVIRATTRCLRQTYSDGTTECRSGGNGTPRSRVARRRIRSPLSRMYHRARGTSRKERRPPCGRHEASRGGRALRAGRLCRGARRSYSHAACLPIHVKITRFGPISLARARRVSGRRQTFRGAHVGRGRANVVAVCAQFASSVRRSMLSTRVSVRCLPNRACACYHVMFRPARLRGRQPSTVPIVQRPRTWPFQGQDPGSNPGGDANPSFGSQSLVTD